MGTPVTTWNDPPGDEAGRPAAPPGGPGRGRGRGTAWWVTTIAGLAAVTLAAAACIGAAVLVALS